MTRFARAKGSKSSNERKEEDATPWHVMRQQLANQFSNDDLKCTEDLSQIVKNAKSNQLEQAKEIWSDFGEIKSTSVKKKKENNKNRESNTKNEHTLVVSDATIDQSTNKKDSQKTKTDQQKIRKSLKPNDKSENHSRNIKKSVKLNKTEKQDYKKVKTFETNTEKETVSNKSSFVHFPDKTSIQNKLNKKTTVNTKYSQNNDKAYNFKHRKNFGHSSSYTIVANGREIEIVRYDGFLVKKDDAQQLQNLRRKLKSQNIPTDKIKAIMKLERRKAEKSLSREKNTVCFHCRKFGHNFADCPDIKDSEASKSGICFKCGSTEHTHFECKVSQTQNFRYAVCFVCKEQGHIARQCTLNPQGQYPKGGSCHLCGEVTHLRKDCPKAVEEKPTLTVNSLKNGQLEDIDEVELTKTSDKKRKKLITF